MRTLWKHFQALWNWWPPGVCVAMLGVLAAISTIFATATVTLVEKAVWTFVFFMLMSVEVVVIIKERTKQDRQYAEDRERQNKTHLEQIKQIQDMRSASDAHNTSVMRLLLVANDPSSGLKKQTLQLSEAILDFAFTRLQQRPQPAGVPFYMTIGQTMEAGWKQMAEASAASARLLEYDAETIRRFRQNFGERTRRMVNELTAQGYTSDVLTQLLGEISAGNAPESFVRMVGETLGALAENVIQKS